MYFDKIAIIKKIGDIGNVSLKASGRLLLLNIRIYSSLLKNSNTSAAATNMVSSIVATDFIKGIC